MRTSRHGRLVPPEELESLQEAEAEDRKARFAMGARGLSMGPTPTTRGVMMDYQRLHEDPEVQEALMRYQLARGERG